MNRTVALLKRTYLCQGLKRKVQEYVKTCDICQKSKADHHLPRGHTQVLEVPVKKWEYISMDFVKMPAVVQESTEVKLNEILTVTDRATKMVTLIPCHNEITAYSVAELFWWVVVRYHGFPKSIASDRDPLFMSVFRKELLSFLNIQPIRSSPYHPQTNSQAERTNQTM